ncbi:MAG: hypothetical protein LBH20_11150 [Treponema sp.]|nr:hypothetical protein [Treponema sp.]
MKKIIVLAMVAILLTSGLVLASCGGCPDDGNCKYDASGASSKQCTDACISKQVAGNPTGTSFKCNC